MARKSFNYTIVKETRSNNGEYAERYNFLENISESTLVKTIMAMIDEYKANGTSFLVHRKNDIVVEYHDDYVVTYRLYKHMNNANESWMQPSIYNILSYIDNQEVFMNGCIVVASNDIVNAYRKKYGQYEDYTPAKHNEYAKNMRTKLFAE